MKRTLAWVVLMAGSTGSVGCAREPQLQPASTPAPMSALSTSAPSTPESKPEPRPAPTPSSSSRSASATRGARPNGNVTLGHVSVSGAAVSDAAVVVARMRAGFRDCYNRSLLDDPEGRGALQLTLNVDSDGDVQDVSAGPAGRLSARLVQCVRARCQSARFAIAAGGKAKVSVAVTFATH